MINEKKTTELLKNPFRLKPGKITLKNKKNLELSNSSKHFVLKKKLIVREVGDSIINKEKEENVNQKKPINQPIIKSASECKLPIIKKNSFNGSSLNYANLGLSTRRRSKVQNNLNKRYSGGFSEYPFKSSAYFFSLSDKKPNIHNTQLKKNSLFGTKENFPFKLKREEKKLSNDENNKMNFAITQSGIKEDGTIKINQDSYVKLSNVFGLSNFDIFGILDGHGVNGHLVSQFLKQKIEDFFKSKRSLFTPQEMKIHPNITEYGVYEKLSQNECKVIKKLYKTLQQELKEQNFDVNFSGSTCVLVFRLGKKLIISNTGDSRGILVKETVSKPKIKGNQSIFHKLEVEQLSFDHKPTNQEEYDRIIKAGGQIEQSEEDGIKDGPFRVWVKGEKYPGIAISRSIGDEIAKTVGVTYQPEIIIKDINCSSKYIVIASDGIWEFLSNEDVMNIINPYYLNDNVEGACREVVAKANELWKKEDIVRDDITIVIGFLELYQNKKAFI